MLEEGPNGTLYAVALDSKNMFIFGCPIYSFKISAKPVIYFS
jgi:hypothetical protein